MNPVLDATLQFDPYKTTYFGGFQRVSKQFSSKWSQQMNTFFGNLSFLLIALTQAFLSFSSVDNKKKLLSLFV